MCGIIAVMRRASDRRPPAPDDLLAAMRRGREAAAAALGANGEISPSLEAAEQHLNSVDRALRGIPGLRCMLAHPELVTEIDACAEGVERSVRQLEQAIDSGALELGEHDIEALNARLVSLKDV